MGRVRKKSGITEGAVVYWNIGIYIRLSRLDEKDENISISEQCKIIMEYVEQNFTKEDRIVGFYVDDGLSGTDDTQDAFRQMLNDVYAKKINCIICRTLSKEFWNYADQGRYLEEIFPQEGIRFISISKPHVDSYYDPEAIQSGMEIPIFEFIKERYAAKTSGDIRKTFEAKRKRGEFVGAFAPYGYIKSPDNKHKLIVDKDAACIVKKIYQWFANDGLSKTAIANRLNAMGVPSPRETKRNTQKTVYKDAHVDENDAKWTSSVIIRILKNEVYIGNMVQGRQRVISNKTHTTVPVPEDEWIRVQDTHEAIIDKHLFARAQRLQSRNTRTAPGQQEVHFLSGLVHCWDCKKVMRRKISKNHAYYHCRTNAGKGTDCKCSIRADKILESLIALNRLQVEMVPKLTETLEIININHEENVQSIRLNSLLKMRQQEVEKVLAIYDNLLFDWKSGEVNKEDYIRIQRSLDERITHVKESITLAQDEVMINTNGFQVNCPYLERFMKEKNIKMLERGLMFEMVDAIYIHKEGSITIDFNFIDEIERLVKEN